MHEETHTHIWTSPYRSSWPEMYLTQAGSKRFIESKITIEADIDKLIAESDDTLPDLLIMGNFVVDRHVFKHKALRAGIDVIHGEDGFIPHYNTLHVDPVGFCWESSLPQMKFRGQVSDEARDLSLLRRNETNDLVKKNPFPEDGKKRVLFPLQLLADKVNQYSLNVQDDWLKILKHVRKTLPDDIELWIKPHPRARNKQINETAWASTQKNVHVFIGDLYSALHYCDGVVGVNSTVLVEARLLFNKPVWAYGDSWYTNHIGIKKDDYLESYRDWFLGQLLARQYAQGTHQYPEKYRQWLLRRTYNSYLKHGEDIFGFEGIPL